MSRHYGSLPVVAEVSLEIGSGEFFCLLGPSGCGKSTLLRMLAGFEFPDRGRVLIEGRDITCDPPHKRPLNMMFQSYALFPHLSVAENVRYGLRWSGMSRSDAASRVAAMLELVRMGGLGGRYPAQISGGQRQRVALARALARRPRVLLLDEPLAALDRRLREETQAELKELQRRLQTTFVMVTHDQNEAMSMADRIGLMESGRIVQVGPPREIYEKPTTRFAAGFLGDVNLIDGKVVETDGPIIRVATRVSEEPIEVLTDPPDRFRAGDGVAIAIRPENITVGNGPDACRRNVLGGNLVGATYLGGTTTLVVQLAGGQRLKVSCPSGGTGFLPERGREITVAFPAHAALPLR